MNIRNTLVALALGLASSMAMAGTTLVTPANPASKSTAATPAKASRTRAIAHKAASCKQGEALVKGKCATKGHA